MAIAQSATISFKVEPGFKKRLAKFADQEFRSTSGFIKNALQFYLDNRNDIDTITPIDKRSKYIQELENIQINDLVGPFETVNDLIKSLDD